MAEITRGQIIRDDVAWFDGVTRTASRLDATGGTVTGLNLGDEVDVLQVFGAGTNRTVTAINDAVTRLGGANATLLFSTGTWTIDSNLTIPSNVTCHIPSGTVFDVSSGVTLTLSGFVFTEKPDSWTSGAGTVTISLEGPHFGVYHKTAAETSASATIVSYFPRPGNALRYGTNTTPLTTDMTTAIQTAINVASWSGRRAYIPAGDYLYSQLYLHYDSSNNTGFNSTGAEAGPLIIEGDGSMHTNHVTNSVTAGTYLQSSETTNNTVLLDIPTGGDTANQSRIQIRNMSFKAATAGYVLQLNDFQDMCLLANVFVYNSGAGGGITMFGYFLCKLERVIVLGQHVGFSRDPVNCTGIGIRMQANGGSHSLMEHVSCRGFDVGFSVGDSGATVKEHEFLFCEAIACNYGWMVNVDCEGTTIRKCNGELLTYRAVETVGAVEGFRVDGGQYAGCLSRWLASKAYATNDTVHNDSGNIYRCTTGGTSAGSGGPTGTGSGISDNTVVWDFNVASAEATVAATIELDTDTITPVIEYARIRVAEEGSGVLFVEDNSMHPKIDYNVFGVDFSGVTNGTCINANGSTAGGIGTAVHNQNLGGLITMFDTPYAFSLFSDPADVVVQQRVRTISLAATLAIGSDRIVQVSGTGTTITAISPSDIAGQEVIIRIGSSGVTMTHSAALNLAGDVDWVTAATAESRHFWCDGTNWIQVE